MNRRLLLPCLALIALAACQPAVTATPPPPAAPTAAPTAVPPTEAPAVAEPTATVAVVPTDTPASLGVLNMEGQDSNSLASMPYALALDDLAAQGYTVNATVYDDLSLAVIAQAQGDLDVATPGLLAAWSAVAQGAEVVTVLERSTNNWILLARQDLKTCADLQGRPVAVLGTGAVTTAMLHTYMEQNCPGVAADELIVPSTPSRRAALLSGEADAALVLLDDVLRFETDAPGQFHVLISFGDEMPQLTVSGFTVPRRMLTERRAAVKDVIRAMLLERRKYQDPQLLADQLVDYLGVDEETARANAELYLAHGIWDVNGALNRDMVETNLNFLKQAAGLDASLQPEDVADWSVLNEVLDEIGRQ
jgi:ABC-type nitrate/sulfonate/bicarbonate transport system substrate-binding protein